MEKDYILTIENISKTFIRRDSGLKKKYDVVLKDVSLNLPRGMIISIVGESGCGKTTLLKAIMRITDIDSGKIIFDGRDITHETYRKMHVKMQAVFQSPFLQLNPKMKAADIIAEGCFYGKMNPALLAEIKEICKLNNKILQSYPSELSGGECQRVAIVRALTFSPELMLFDEPLSSIDMHMQVELLQMIKRVQKVCGFSAVFVTHNISLACLVADIIYTMCEGEIVEECDSKKYISLATHECSRKLIDSIPRIENFMMDKSFDLFNHDKVEK